MSRGACDTGAPRLTRLPLEPAALLTRLQTIGFARVTITVDCSVTFVATKASAES